MYVYVCFDVEDLVHPDSDDVARDIAEMLAADEITAMMCVVGEKARLWERRGRDDVIDAVRRHDVGLHTNRHSVHPAVAEYLADKGWEDGVAEAMRQEGPGVQDLSRILGAAPSTWGTPGSSWGPQIPAATRRLGIPSNIYSHARSGETGACWFAGQLCYSDYMSLPGGEDACGDDAAFEAALPTLLQRISDFQRQGGACLGLFAAHPTRLRYTVFWDALNFAHGQNTPPESYRFAPRKDDATYERGLRNLRRMIHAVRDLPGVELISVRSLNNRILPPADHIHWEEIRPLAQRIAESDAFCADNPQASPAQALDVLARASLYLAGDTSIPDTLALREVLGPINSPPALESPIKVPLQVMVALARELVDHVDTTGHLPTRLIAQDTPVGPGPLLRTLAVLFLDLDRGRKPDQVIISPGPEEPDIAARLAEEGIYRRLPGWPPHPPDLVLDRLALHTRLQSWSLRPAVLS
ncbi:MAG TPA: hypothetical protein G4O02_13885 [Caldilineae bacterium]|nr:hypothetical protein [Caldilineae bacterium]